MTFPTPDSVAHRVLLFLRRQDRLVCGEDVTRLCAVNATASAVESALRRLEDIGLVRRGRLGRKQCWCATHEVKR